MNPPEQPLSRTAATYPAGGLWWTIQDAANRIWFRTPSSFRSSVRLARYFAPACISRRVPVAWLYGPARPSGRPATLLVAGSEPWVNYLPGRFFAEPPKRKLIDRASIWSLPGLLKQLRSSADMTVVRVDRLTARMLPDGAYLRMPEWIGASLILPENLPALFRRNHNLREDMRRMRKNRLRPVVSNREADFDFFYETMHAPYIRARHHELGFVIPYHYMRQWFRRGGLLFAEQDGELLAGELFTRYRDVFHFCVVGTQEGNYAPVKQGALAALNFFGIQHAKKMGCKRVEFGTSRSVLQDGVLRFKSKWGARFYQENGSLFELLLHWNRFEGAVADFFSHTSPIFCDKGKLAGMHTTPGDQQAASAARKALWINGLDRLYLVGRKQWSTDIQLPPQTRLLDPQIKPGFF